MAVLAVKVFKADILFYVPILSGECINIILILRPLCFLKVEQACGLANLCFSESVRLSRGIDGVGDKS